MKNIIDNINKIRINISINVLYVWYIINFNVWLFYLLNEFFNVIDILIMNLSIVIIFEVLNFDKIEVKVDF